MKRLAFVAAFFIGLALPSRAQDQPKDTGMELQRDCQEVIAKQRTDQDRANAIHCLGYVAGVAFTMSMWEGIAKHNQVGVEQVPACLPQNATAGEYVRVVLHYIDEHPNDLHQSYGVLVYVALAKAYPCPAK